MIEDKSQEKKKEVEPVSLKVLRLKTGLSQVKLAARLEIDPATVSRTERGLIEPTWELWQVKLLAELIGVDRISDLPDYLGTKREDSKKNDTN